MNTKKGFRVGMFIMSLCSSLAFSDFPGSSPPAMTGQAQSFDAAVTQNTQKGLQTFSGVNVASFLKGMDSDSDSGFSSGNSGGDARQFPMDMASQGNISVDEALGSEVSEEQDAIDTQIEGGWNG